MPNLRFLYFLLIVLITLHCGQKINLHELNKFAATESFPEAVFLDTIAAKRALVVVAHDDDDCAMAGTIAKLTSQG